MKCPKSGAGIVIHQTGPGPNFKSKLIEAGEKMRMLAVTVSGARIPVDH